MLSLTANLTSAQESNLLSPYSRYGLGDIAPFEQPWNRALGGSGLAHYDFLRPNFLNPASLAGISLTHLDVGFFARQSWLRTTTAEQRATNNNLQLVALSFPISKKIGVGIGMTPYSSMDYAIQRTTDSSWLGWREQFRGTGGINRYFIQSGISINKKLRVGFKANWLYGNIDKSHAYFFPDSLRGVNSEFKEDVKVNTFMFDFGAQYQKSFKKGRYFSAGITWQMGTQMGGSLTEVSRRFTSSANGAIFIRDTISLTKSNLKATTLPGRIGLGMQLGKENVWHWNFDFYHQAWSRFSFGNTPDVLQNTITLATGAEWIPNYDAPATGGNYLKTIRYRAGFRHEQTPVKIGTTGIQQTTFSIGLGLPQRRSFTMIDLGLDFGTMGTTANGLIQDRFIRLNVGIGLSDKWFLKRKYD